MSPLGDKGLWNPSDLDFDHSRSIKVKSDDVIGLAIYGFLFMIKSNIGPNSTPLRDMTLESEWPWVWLSRSIVMLPLDSPYMVSYSWLIVPNIGPNSTPLRDIRLWNPSYLDFHRPRSIKVKSDDVIGLAIYGFLFMVNSNIGPRLLYEISGFKIWVTLTLTFQVRSRSKVMVSLDSHYMVSY